MKLTLHFKKGQNREGLQHQHFYSLTTSETPMCSTNSPSQEPHQEQSQPHHESRRDLEEPRNPIPQPHPGHESPHQEKFNLDHQQQRKNDPETEEDEEDQEDQDNPGINLSAFLPPASSIDVAVADVKMASVNPPKRPNKRKKGKGSLKKQLAIEKKLQTLLENLNPVPFIPSKILDFPKHEKLLKRLGLWEFFHIEFDRNIRFELIAQLVANYDSKLRCSYVNEFRIAVNRADLARALKLPVKKEKGVSLVNLVAADEMDLDFEALSEESISFMEGFVSNWVLLHEDAWMMPNEVLNWTKAIKDGHPEKVDWAGLFWFMVEKELMKGEHLVDCYYASHLQYLIKSQREEVMLREPKEVVLKEEQDMVDLDAEEEEVIMREEQDKVDLNVEEEEVVVKKEQDRVELDTEKVVLKVEQDAAELNAEVKKEEDGGNDGDDVRMGGLSEVPEQENGVLGGLNIELTLGQDVAEKKEVKAAEMMAVEESKEEQEQGQWLLDRRNSVGEHFMQRCNMGDACGFDNLEERKEEGDELEGEGEGEGEGEEDGEAEGEDRFDIGPSDDTFEGDGLTGNFLQAMGTTQIGFSSHEHLHDDSLVDLVAGRNDLQHMAAGGHSFYGNAGKREIDHEHDISHRSLNGSNKRLRVDGLLDHKPLDFGACMEQMQQLTGRARLMYEEKEQNQEQLNVNQQILLNELQKRDNMIEHLHKSKCEEIEKRDAEMYHLERELYLMGNILEDYRKALKQTNKAFAEYRQKYQLPEQPIYKDAGPGGVVLTTAEIENQRLKEEEEYRRACLILEQKAKEAEEGYALQFGEYLDKVLWLDKRLAIVENGVKELRDSYSKPDVSETEQKIGEMSGCETERKTVETSACETDQKVVESSECEAEQKVVEISECPPSE